MNKSKQPHRARLVVPFIRIVVGLTGAVGFTSAQAAQPTISQTFQQNWSKIAQATEPVTTSSVTDGMGFPRAYLYPADSGGTIVKKILSGWHNGADDVSFVKYTGWAGSTDGHGAAWTAPAPTGPGATNPEMGQVIKRVTDGIMISVPVYANSSTNSATSFSFSYHTSTNQGVSWTKYTGGLIDMTGYGAIQPNLYRFHRGIIQDNDGTLYAPALVIGSPYKSILMRSTNQGVNWKWWSTIAADSGGSIHYNETTVARCVDGSMLAVIRNGPTGTLDSLKYRRSTNNGQSWIGSPANLPGLSANTGVDPVLCLMPNGMLALGYGNHLDLSPKDERDIYMAFSADGNGTSWSNTLTTFTANQNVWQGNSTGYTGLTAVGAHRLMQFSDRGEKTYYYTDSLLSPNPFSIWTKIVDVVPNHRNRIDLKSKYAAVGSGMISTDLTYSNATFPEARASGAFDSVIDYWSGAFKTGSSGTYTIDLQEAHTLNAVGICLHYAEAQSATVELSTNGTTWTNVKTYSNAKHRALDYTSFTATSARYVRVTLTGAGIGGRIGLNEIELYSTADTYENYAQYLVPISYSAASGVFLVTGSTGYGYQSERTLYMKDTSTTTTASISKTTTATTSKTFEFAVKPVGYSASGGAIQFHVLSGASPVYHMAVFSNGSVNYHTTSWTQVGSAGANTVPLSTWTRLRVVATISPATASVYKHVGGTWSLLGTAAKKGTATSMDGFSFGSGGSGSINDEAFFDDVSF